MGIFSRFFHKKPERKHIVANYDVLRRRYDSDNWSQVDRASANRYDTRERRQQLRDMARSEFSNNPHLSGLLLRIKNEIVGTGPRLSVVPKTRSQTSERAANRLESLWRDYAEEIDFNKILSLMSLERPVGGETFTQWFPNPRLQTVPVGLTVYEGDQFRSFDEWDIGSRRGENDGPVDGIEFDSYGNVIGYERLQHHPYGKNYSGTNFMQTEIVDADVCFHWFRQDRPSQHRGVSEVAPMLEIYRNLRRFIESKVAQEELRAKMMGTVRTGFAPDSGCADLGDEPIDMMIGDGQFTTLPDGWSVDMFKFEPTAAGIAEFMRTSLSWATQALLAPWNIAAGDSSDYNFASGRLDHMSFYHYINIMRKELEKQFLCRFFNDWAGIATNMNAFPSGLGNYECVWHWDQREAIDPLKQANADKTLKEAGLLDETDYARRQGVNALDWAESRIRFELQQVAIRKKLEDELGVKTPTIAAPAAPKPEPQPEERPVDQDS